MAVDTQALAGQINAIYESTLGRPADVEGLMYFANAVLSGGGSLADVQQAIASSPEAQGMRAAQAPVPVPTPAPALAPQATTPLQPAAVGGGGLLGGSFPDTQGLAGQINDIYKRVLGRDADVEGLKYFGNAVLSGGGTLADVERDIRGSEEFKKMAVRSGTGTVTPGNQVFRQDVSTEQDRLGIRSVPYGSQMIGNQISPAVDYSTYSAPSLQNFLAGSPEAANLSPFQQALQYQAALPSMVRQFSPSDVPATYQQIVSPQMRLDISQTQIPSWLQTAINAQRTKDGIALTDQDKFTAANPTVTNSGLTPFVAPGTTGAVTPGTTGGLLAANQISPQIISGYTDYLGRPAGDIDLAGASYWQGLLNSGTPIADIYSGLAGSKEGTAYAPTRAAKIEAANAPVVTYYNE